MVKASALEAISVRSLSRLSHCGVMGNATHFGRRRQQMVEVTSPGRIPSRAKGGAGAAPNSQACRSCCRCDQGLQPEGDIVIDPFGGSGTALIAAQKSGRRARLIEYDPAYCDVILRRFEATTGDRATLAENGQSFEDVAAHREPRQYEE
jgi:hypothetical protein